MTEETMSSSKKKEYDITVDLAERIGLTNERAEELYQEWGYNELPEITISLWKVFFLQFTGTMPYMLELAAIIAIVVLDYADFIIIIGMLCCNAVLGFHEQMKAAASLRELTQKMEQKIAVLRDGKAEYLLTRLLVPGDVVLLIGGVSVPADIDWLEGDVLSVDTAALTGEPIPRKYPSPEHGKLILCGTIIRAGEAYGVVRKTGIHTEIGSASAEVMKDKTVVKVSLFEERVLNVVKKIILLTLVDVFIIFIIQGTYKGQFTESSYKEDLLSCLAIIVAAIPIALPIVLNVTMALGAGKMAREFDAVVTSLPALQDISSMTVLCSDKTGTLTTAKISIHAESVWTNDKFTQRDVALYAALASNRDKKEDAIDRSVIQHFDRLFGPSGITQANEFTKVRSVGFNPIYKRVIYEYSHPRLGRVVIGKGLPTKVLDTADGGEDDAADQWKVQKFNELYEVVKKVDIDFSKAGYKTLGVSVKFNDEPWIYCGILPMLDPPRHDTAQTIKNLQNAGINVKMITGDHLNIAKETARLIGLGTNIHPGEATRDNTPERDDLVLKADGFAQVLPKDKREVVQVLRNTYKQVVGMTGDGVNDAPALSAAQCGVAVDDATDAAKNAAAIILTSPGLSAIYSSVIESRRIFRKLKAYVTYRLAASIQIVISLTLLIYISNCPINSLYIILLALFNDLTMLPIAYDNQNASVTPEKPDVINILTLAVCLGGMQTGFTMLFSYVSGPSGLFSRDYAVGYTKCDKITQAAIWLQMYLATEFLIFSTRAPSYIWVSLLPSPALFGSVFAGCLLGSFIAGFAEAWGKIPGTDILIIWLYNLICLVLIDIVKVEIFKAFGQNLEVLADYLPEHKKEEQYEKVDVGDIEARPATPTVVKVVEDFDEDKIVTRATLSSSRLGDWAKNNLKNLTEQEKAAIQSYQTKVRSETKIHIPTGLTSETKITPPTDTIRVTPRLTSSSTDLRPMLAMGLRPNTPNFKNLK